MICHNILFTEYNSDVYFRIYNQIFPVQKNFQKWKKIENRHAISGMAHQVELIIFLIESPKHRIDATI